ncbi:unnamed protein product [Prorocentrum cordatum]|uniref:Uncharacterized protein n=1 Tax=Prorocentrum cordatum TaxID=2364126 RepID=A0ABN9XL72_9DINO|nr:unnamed protein product [Polarella glacialis]
MSSKTLQRRGISMASRFLSLAPFASAALATKVPSSISSSNARSRGSSMLVARMAGAGALAYAAVPRPSPLAAPGLPARRLTRLAAVGAAEALRGSLAPPLECPLPPPRQGLLPLEG